MIPSRAVRATTCCATLAVATTLANGEEGRGIRQRVAPGSEYALVQNGADADRFGGDEICLAGRAATMPGAVGWARHLPLNGNNRQQDTLDGGADNDT